MATLDDVVKELKDRAQELQNVQSGELGVEKPYSFLLLDQLQDELAALKSNLASNQSSQSIANEDILQAKQTLEQKEQAYRLAKEEKQVLSSELSPEHSMTTPVWRLKSNWRRKPLIFVNVGWKS